MTINGSFLCVCLTSFSMLSNLVGWSERFLTNSVMSARFNYLVQFMIKNGVLYLSECFEVQSLLCLFAIDFLTILGSN